MGSILGKYKRIFSEMDKGEKARLYLLKGREKFIMEQFAEKVVSSIVDKSARPFNLSVQYGKNINIEEFLTTAHSFPFMADKRVLILKELENLRGSCDKFSEYCLNPLPSSCVIFICNTHDQDGRKSSLPRGYQKLQSIIKKNGTVVEFGKLFEGDLQQWVIQRSRIMGFQMSAEAGRILVENIGDNIYDLKNELEKIAIVHEGEKVNPDDVMRVVGNHRFNGIYDLVDSLRPDGEDSTLGILFNIINSGTERCTVIVYNLIRNFITLLNIKNGYKAGGFWFGKREKQAKLYTTEEILLWLENLRVTDLKLKSSSLPDDLILTSCFVHSFESKLMQ